MSRALVVGGSGAIGRALLGALRDRHPEVQLWATHCNTPPVDLPGVQWWRLDLRNPHGIEAAAERARETLVERSLDAIFVASGWLHGPAHGPEKSLRDLDARAFEQAMAVNATGPLLLLSALRPYLRRGGRHGSARVVVLSAKLGSVADNHLGGWYAYRMSKAALNMGVRCAGIELSRGADNPLVSAVHPGTTRSALSEPFAKRGLRVVDAETTAERLLDFFDRMEPRHQGGFFHWDGTPLPG